MPFGSGDRELLRAIGDQLGRALTDLAAIKQQVTDQQHAIDQIRQDTTAAINTGLTENRAVIRSGLDRANETVTGPLASIGSELVAIRGGIQQLDGRIKAAAADVPVAAQEREPEAAPKAVPVEDQRPDPEPEAPASVADEEILRAAAGISAATLHAHRDTWEFLVKHAGPDQHFHVPGEIKDAVGTVQASISGPTLVAALTSLDTVSRTAAAPGTRAIAHHLYERIKETVEAIAAAPRTGTDPVKIVIDDRAPAASVHDGQSPND